MGKIVKLINSFEEKVNKIINFLVNYIFTILNKIIPHSFIQKAKKIQKKIIDRKQKLSKKINNIKLLIIEKTSPFLKKFSQVNLKRNAKKITSPKFYKDQGSNIKDKANNCGSLLNNFISKIDKKMRKIKGGHVLSVTCLLVIASITSIQIYQSSRTIVKTEFKESDLTGTRKVAGSNQKSVPGYYGYKDRLSKIEHMTIPAFIEDIGKYRNLKVDLAINFTNRTAKKFYDSNRHLFFDQLQTTLEPTLASFPLKQEGKIILRTKIQDEINNIFLDKEIQGRVKNVKIVYILAN